MIWGRYDTHMVNSQSEGWGLVKYDMGRYGIQLMSIRKGGKSCLQLRAERSFRNARPIYFVAAKDEFDPLGSSICSEKKREKRKHL